MDKKGEIEKLTKLIKPNKEIYILAIKRFNLNPIETVFIDDKIENIKHAGRGLGVHEKIFCRVDSSDTDSRKMR